MSFIIDSIKLPSLSIKVTVIHRLRHSGSLVSLVSQQLPTALPVTPRRQIFFSLGLNCTACKLLIVALSVLGRFCFSGAIFLCPNQALPRGSRLGLSRLFLFGWLVGIVSLFLWFLGCFGFGYETKSYRVALAGPDLDL